MKVRVAENGRLVLPKAVRQAVGIEGETQLSVTVEDGEIRLSPAARNVALARALFKKYVKHDFSSDDFLATRERD